MLPINIISGTTQFVLYIQWEFAVWLFIYNESLQGDCLTRITCKTVLTSLLNEVIFQATSASKYQTPSPNTDWFSHHSDWYWMGENQ